MQEADIADAVPRMLELTRTLVPLLLESDDPRLAILRQQWTAASVTIAAPSYWGFFAEFSVPPEVPRVDTANRCDGNAHIPAEHVEAAEQSTGCVLYVEGGVLAYLEVYTAVRWPRPPVFGAPQHVEPFTFETPDASTGGGA